MNKLLTGKLVVILLLISSITYASSEPTDADINNAMRIRTEEAKARMKNDMGDRAEAIAPAFKSAIKVSCQNAADNKGYLCDYILTITTKATGDMTRNSNGLFINTKSGWRLAVE